MNFYTVETWWKQSDKRKRSQNAIKCVDEIYRSYKMLDMHNYLWKIFRK